ncbi:MAG TPA: hypothetical protein VK868_10360 [Pyrinomonadaceae bacterium]|jgi:hypothetical protein|nr:hypothetical protein [Pyrinomonadaceae bacterium]
MAGQHIENLFRRFKGEIVDVKTVSGGIYSGRISEVTNDYIELIETSGPSGPRVFITFISIESIAVLGAD